MVAEVDAATALVVIVNGALVAPAGTVTLAGTEATDGLLLESATCAPPAGAGAFNVTVPVEFCRPPITVVGFSVSEDRTGGITVSVVVWIAPPEDAEIVTGVEAATALVVAVNVVLLAPAGTVTLPGTVAAGLLLDSVTGAPPAGAGPFSVTVPVELLPPVTVVGFTPSEETTGGVTLSVLVRVTPL